MPDNQITIWQQAALSAPAVRELLEPHSQHAPSLCGTSCTAVNQHLWQAGMKMRANLTVFNYAEEPGSVPPALLRD